MSAAKKGVVVVGGKSGPELPIARASTLTEQVYTLVKQRITTNECKSGTHLVERQLAEEFNISKTPVREALARLQKEGLVELVPGRGMRVRSLDPTDVTDILELREVLEGFAAERAALYADNEQLAEMERILDESERLSETSAASYKELDEAFHALIQRASRNRHLSELMGVLSDRIRLVMITSVDLPGRRTASLGEHRRLLAALQAHDAPKAAECGRAHIRHIRRAMEDVAGDSR